MTREEALRKAAGCLRLAQSANQAEAALAAAKAQEIMDRYGIEAAQLELAGKAPEPDEPIRDFGDDPLATACAHDRHWTARLALTLSTANGCCAYQSRLRTGGVEIKLAGRPSDVQTVRYLYALVKRQIDGLRRLHAAGHSAIYRREFAIGCVEAVREKLEQQRRETVEAMEREQAGSCTALVPVRQALERVERRTRDAEVWANARLGLRQVRSSIRTHESARAAGRAAGATIRLAGSRAGLGRGVAGLVGGAA